MATKVALDLDVFPTLAEATAPVPLATLAAGKKQADPLLIGERSILLMLWHCRRLTEQSACCVSSLPTTLSASQLPTSIYPLRYQKS